MATWTAIYIKTNALEAVCATLQHLTGIDTLLQSDTFPSMYGYHLLNEADLPSYLAVAQHTTEWIIILHNSFSALATWGRLLSSDFNTTLVVCTSQPTTERYAWSCYQKGRRVQEIEYLAGKYTHKEGFSPDTLQTPFDFEQQQTIAQSLGFELLPHTVQSPWHILRAAQHQALVKQVLKESVPATLESKPRPWWRFW